MKSKRVLTFICAFSILISTILGIVDYWCFNNEFYSYEYEELNTAEYIGMSKDDLNRTTGVLLSYLRDKNLTLDITCNVKGQDREVFNDREKAHMIDVRQLYLDAMNIKNICLVIFSLTAIIITFKKSWPYFYGEYKKALFVFLIIFTLIAIFCAIDFDSFWTSFHHIFFAGNDLWLLDPRTDILIMMVPSKFFFDLCVSIVFTIFVTLVLFTIVFKIIDKKVFNNDKRRFI